MDKNYNAANSRIPVDSAITNADEQKEIINEPEQKADSTEKSPEEIIQKSDTVLEEADNLSKPQKELSTVSETDSLQSIL